MSWTNGFSFLLLKSINRFSVALISVLSSNLTFGESTLLAPHAFEVTDNDTTHRQPSINLYLEVFINRTRQPNLLAVTESGDKLTALAADLTQLGLVLNDYSPSDVVTLTALPELTVDYRVNTQQLFLMAPLSLLSRPTTQVNIGLETQSNPASASPGVLMNYDLYVSHEDHHRLASAATELRLFGFGHGVFSHTMVSRSQHYEDQNTENSAVTLNTFNEWSFPDSATHLIMGDAISGGLNWTRPLRFGGIQYGRNFSLQPYRTTTPLTSFLGKATLPSSVELYIDGIQRYQSDVPVGPFEFNTAPGITGAGQAQLVTTDILGRTTTLNIPFYNTQSLLAKGLSDWSINLGFVHEDYGIRSFQYDDKLIGIGTVRYGINNQLTVEGHAETSGNIRNGGVGFVWQPQLAGVFSLSHSRSNESQHKGHQTAWRYSWSNARFNFSVASQRTFGDYRDVASHYGSQPATISEQILAGISTSSLGSFGINATRFSDGDSDEDPSRYAGLYWNNSLAKGVYLSTSYNQNLNDRADRNLQIGINISFGRHYQFSSSAQRDTDNHSYRSSLHRSLPSDGGYGWRIQHNQNDTIENSTLEASWLGRYGQVDAGLAHNDGNYAHYLQASGGLVWMNNDYFVARHIDDGFAVVSTEGLADIPVKLENRLIGQTDENGHLLVTRLNAWQRNKLSIEPLDLPADRQVTMVDHITTPSDRAGTLVDFSVKKVDAAIVKLVDQYGHVLPVSSRVHLLHHPSQITYVGFDGETYLDNLRPHNHLQVDTPTMTCHADFPYIKQANSINYIGPIPCIAKESQ